MLVFGSNNNKISDFHKYALARHPLPQYMQKLQPIFFLHFMLMFNTHRGALAVFQSQQWWKRWIFYDYPFFPNLLCFFYYAICTSSTNTLTNTKVHTKSYIDTLSALSVHGRAPPFSKIIIHIDSGPVFSCMCIGSDYTCCTYLSVF